MAGSILHTNRRYARKGRVSHRPMAEINVTPMVDVMLVLLIVFMVAAPLLTVGVPVELPKTQAQALSEEKAPLVITVNGEGEIFLQETPIDMDGLVPKLQAITNNNPDASIYVRGDRSINYGRILEIMGLVSSAGFNKVSLVAEMPDGGGARGGSKGRRP